jgi:hypothetical protein
MGGPHRWVAPNAEVRLGQVLVIQSGDIGRGELVGETWEQFREHLAPSPQYRVHMTSLGYAPPVVDTTRQQVSLHHRDRLIEVRQHTRGQQAAHTRTQHNRVPVDLDHAATRLAPVSPGSDIVSRKQRVA